MKSITTQDFISAFKSYHSDRMFKSALKDVGEGFLVNTGRTSVSGAMYTSVCLLLAQAMSNMLGGYGGDSTRNNKYLNEAIAFDLAATSNNKVCDRYKDLVDTVHNLQLTEKSFASLLDDFIK